MRTENPKKEVYFLLLAILGFSLLLRFCVGVGYFNSMDTYWYRGWALDLPNGLFNVYARAEDITLDYPPLYLFCLYFTGLAYRVFGEDCSNMMQMFLMKFWPIIFDVLCSFLLYKIGSKFSQGTGLLAAALWALNPSVFFNTAMWGQTDQLMALLLILSFWLCLQNRPILACIAFAVAGMTKYQCLLFTPVFLLELYRRSGLKPFLKGCLAAAISVAVVFLPFMIASRRPALFFEVYFGGAGKYPYYTLNAFNLYGIFGLNWVPESELLLDFLPGTVLNLIFILLSLALLVFLYYRGKRTCGFVGGLLFMQCIFMLTTRMHERYQIVVLPFALMAYIIHKERVFLHAFHLLTVMTLINQALLLFKNKLPESSYLVQTYDGWMQFFSVLNLILFAWTVFICIRFFLTEPSKEETMENQKEECPDGLFA